MAQAAAEWNNAITSSEPVDGKFKMNGLPWIGAGRIVLGTVRVCKHVLGGFTHHTLPGFPQKMQSCSCHLFLFSFCSVLSFFLSFGFLCSFPFFFFCCLGFMPILVETTCLTVIFQASPLGPFVLKKESGPTRQTMEDFPGRQ